VRILHVVRGLANSSGTTHIVGPLAEAQARQGHDVLVFYVEKPGRPAVTPDPSLVTSRGFAMTVPSEHVGWSTDFARAIATGVRGVDVVHVHAIWNFPTLWAMRHAHRAGVPYVVAPQGSLEGWALGRSRYPKALYAALAEKPYFDKAACMQALTETEARQCREFGIRAPIGVLPNGVDLDPVEPVGADAGVRAELGITEAVPLVLFLGRVFPKKGLDILVPAFARVVAEHPEAVLAIAGHDAGSGYRAVVEQLVRNAGIQSRVHWLGEVSGDRKRHVLHAADVFVLPSYSEGLPVSVLEAMACSRPVVVTPGCNIPDVSTSEAGWTVDATVDGVTHGLNAALVSKDERLRRGSNGRTLVAAKYTWDRIAQDSVGLYHSHKTH